MAQFTNANVLEYVSKTPRVRQQDGKNSWRDYLFAGVDDRGFPSDGSDCIHRGNDYFQPKGTTVKYDEFLRLWFKILRYASLVVFPVLLLLVFSMFMYTFVQIFLSINYPNRKS